MKFYINEPPLYILEKSVVQAHTSKTKSGKLVQVKQYSNKKTKKEEEASKKKAPKTVNPWAEKYGKYNLVKLPPAEIKKVEANLKGDLNTHAVLSWYNPKTGAKEHSYTREFMHRNADVKWQRLSVLQGKNVSSIGEKAFDLMKNGSGKERECGAIIYIISQTGLRVGTTQVFKRTQNRGVSTLHPTNIKIIKDTVFFNFTGKSYQENKAQIKNADLASYLSTLQKQRAKKDMLFDAEYKFINKFFKNTLGAKAIDPKMKIKDLRTYIATEMATKELFSRLKEVKGKLPKSKAQAQKMVRKIMDEVSEKVAEKLNNTKAIAKASYIHPNLQKAWLNALGADHLIEKSFQGKENVTLDDILKAYPPKKSVEPIDEDDEEICDEYLYVFEEGEEDELNDDDDIEEAVNEGNLVYYIDIEKSQVKAHARKSKSGKMEQVKEYSDKRNKKNVQPKGRPQAKGKPEQQKPQPKGQGQSQGQEGQQEDPSNPVAKLKKKLLHLDFMAKNYSHLVDKKQIIGEREKIKAKIRKIEDLSEEDYGTEAEGAKAKEQEKKHKEATKQVKQAKKEAISAKRDAIMTKKIVQYQDKANRYGSAVKTINAKMNKEGISPERQKKLAEKKKRLIARADALMKRVAVRTRKANQTGNVNTVTSLNKITTQLDSIKQDQGSPNKASAPKVDKEMQKRNEAEVKRTNMSSSQKRSADKKEKAKAEKSDKEFNIEGLKVKKSQLGEYYNKTNEGGFKKFQKLSKTKNGMKFTAIDSKGTQVHGYFSTPSLKKYFNKDIANTESKGSDMAKKMEEHKAEAEKLQRLAQSHYNNAKKYKSLVSRFNATEKKRGGLGHDAAQARKKWSNMATKSEQSLKDVQDQIEFHDKKLEKIKKDYNKLTNDKY